MTHTMNTTTAPTPAIDLHDKVVLPLVSASVLVRSLAQQALDALINYKGVDDLQAQAVLRTWIDAQRKLNEVTAAANAARGY